MIDKASGPNSPFEHPEKQCDQLTGEREVSREMTSECLPSSLCNSNNEPSHDHANTNPIDRVQTNIDCRKSRRAAALARDKIIDQTLS